MKHLFSIFLLTFLWTSLHAAASESRDKYNFNSGWLLSVGDKSGAEKINYADADWKEVTLPYAFNENEAFRLSIEQLTDTIVWYRKHFRLPANNHQKKVFIEFEGVRQGADFYINGKYIGFHENGVMAIGFDLTPHIKYGQENVIAIRIDNNWDYKERNTDTKYQWNNRNFNANYGGIPKNVWLHVTDKLYQTLPLYSNLKTTGVYVYADDIHVKSRKATIHAESQIKNEHRKNKFVSYQVEVIDRDKNTVKAFSCEPVLVKPGETATLKAAAEVENLHFWSWGYGYLYTIKTSLWVDNKKVDEVSTRTGFRKTRFGDGKIWLRSIPAENITSKDVYDAAVQGDKLAQDIFDFTGNILGEAIADAIAFSSPEAIILFGGLAKSGDYIFKPIQKAIDDNVLNIYKGKAKLLMSELKDSDAAVLGASALGWELRDLK